MQAILIIIGIIQQITLNIKPVIDPVASANTAIKEIKLLIEKEIQGYIKKECIIVAVIR